MLPPCIQSHIDDFYSSPCKMTADGVHSHRGGSPRKEECELLSTLILTLRPQATVDWGLGDGAVSMTIALSKKQAGLTERHLTLDPFQREIANGVGLIELEKHGIKADVEFLEQRSEGFLIRARDEERQFDFIFIDGDHSFGGKVTDAHLADQVLKPGGAICFHDSLFVSTAAAIEYLICDRGYEIANINNQHSLIAMARAVKHSIRLGPWYAYHVIPKLGYSTSCLQKPAMAA
jgi:predicted O-methyltransferase YrrM